MKTPSTNTGKPQGSTLFATTLLGGMVGALAIAYNVPPRAAFTNATPLDELNPGQKHPISKDGYKDYMLKQQDPSDNQIYSRMYAFVKGHNTDNYFAAVVDRSVRCNENGMPAYRVWHDYNQFFRDNPGWAPIPVRFVPVIPSTEDKEHPGSMLGSPNCYEEQDVKTFRIGLPMKVKESTATGPGPYRL